MNSGRDPRGRVTSLAALRSIEVEVAWLRKEIRKYLKRIDRLEKRILKLAKPLSKWVN
jgi:hypothetical protein